MSGLAPVIQPRPIANDDVCHEVGPLCAVRCAIYEQRRHALLHPVIVHISVHISALIGTGTQCVDETRPLLQPAFLFFPFRLAFVLFFFPWLRVTQSVPNATDRSAAKSVNLRVEDKSSPHTAGEI